MGVAFEAGSYVLVDLESCQSRTTQHDAETSRTSMGSLSNAFGVCGSIVRRLLVQMGMVDLWVCGCVGEWLSLLGKLEWPATESKGCSWQC